MQLETLLDDQGISYETRHHRPAYTAQQLAQVEHVPGDMVAKPVIVKCRTGYMMCVLPAPKHLDIRRVGEVLGDPDTRLATEFEISELFPDCELGAEPAIGALFDMPTIIDRQLETRDYVLTQAGTHEKSVIMRRVDWEELCDPMIADITID